MNILISATVQGVKIHLFHVLPNKKYTFKKNSRTRHKKINELQVVIMQGVPEGLEGGKRTLVLGLQASV